MGRPGSSPGRAHTMCPSWVLTGCCFAGERRVSHLWRGRLSTIPCMRVRPPQAIATTTAAILKLQSTAVPALRPPLTSAVRRYDTSMRTVNWPRRCVRGLLYPGWFRRDILATFLSYLIKYQPFMFCWWVILCHLKIFSIIQVKENTWCVIRRVDTQNKQ